MGAPGGGTCRFSRRVELVPIVMASVALAPFVANENPKKEYCYISLRLHRIVNVELSSRKSVRIAYLGVALTAFGLSLLTSDVFFVVTSGFILLAAVSAFVIQLSRRQPPICKLEWHL
jgi:hypothetical protein